MNQPGNHMGAMGAATNGPHTANLVGSNDPRKQLNTYIYDYLLKNKHFDVARAVRKSLTIHLKSENGDDGSMDMDSKDETERPSDLPQPLIPGPQSVDNSFLLDWWSQFWDVYAAQHGKGNNNKVNSYLAMTKANQQQKDRQAQLMGQQYGMMRQGMANPAQQAELQKRMMIQKQNSTPAAMQAMHQAAQQKQMINGMQRDGSGMAMGDQRPQSPANAENAPSPSKRPRLDGNAFNGQLGPGARSQGMQGAPMGATSGPGGQMMMPNGMPQGEMGANAFNFNGQNPQQKPMEGMGPNGTQQQMGGQQMDGNGDLFASSANNGQMPGRPGGPGQGPPGNHALQDYQMQLMLLEQQNKKRLLMARQEQDNMTQAPHGPGGGGQPGFGAPAMSPSGSRSGPSPNPGDQAKRGTPKIGGQAGLPGSPMPDGAMPGNRASPIPNGGAFDPNGGIPAGVPPQFYTSNNPGMLQGGMRGPGSHPTSNFNGGQMSAQQMEQLRRQQQQQMVAGPNGMWQGQQPGMMPAPGQGHPQMGTPQQRNSAMPPPPAPQSEQQRTQPPSPQQNTNAPPTPNQTNKAAPKGKKEKADNKKKAAPKKNSTAAGATPASEAEPPTPTPSTPITPMHPSSFTGKNGQPQPSNQNQQPAQAAPQVQQTHQMDPNVGAGLGAFDGGDGGMVGLDFAPLDSNDVLESFDFDSFLHTEDSNAFSGFNDFQFPDGGVETDTMG